jgi:tetratricopeptide (TPR) repeat protein
VITAPHGDLPPRRASKARSPSLVLLVTATLLLAACEIAPSKPKPPPEPPPPAPEPAPEPPPCPQLSARELFRDAMTRLGEGDDVQARRELECALEQRPDSRRTRLVLEQLDADPVEYLGREHFWYTVKPGEALSVLASRYLGSSYKFVILARYNDIAVPDSVSAGQRIRVPGKEPAPAPEPAAALPEATPEPAPSATEGLLEQARAARERGDLEQALDLYNQAVEQGDAPEAAEDELAGVEDALIQRYSTQAYEAEVRGDAREAITLWKRVLAISPQDIEAQVNLGRLAETPEQKTKDAAPEP